MANKQSPIRGLQDGHVYVVPLPTGRSKRDMLALFWPGNWYLAGDGGGAQVIAAGRANYVIVRKIEGARLEPV